MTERPEAEIADLTLLGEDEQRELLAAFSAGPAAAVPGVTGVGGPAGALRGAGPRTARGRPRWWPGTRSWTTRPWTAGPDRLAHALIARGAGPDHVVGLHAGRTAELVVGVLGILKAGAAYLPLDPGQPSERLTAMVEDAAPRWC